MSALLRQRMQRDRLQLLLWILGTAALAASAIGGVDQSYGARSDRVEALAAIMANPVILLLRGLPSGAQREAFTLFLILPFLALMAAFMSTFLAVRHTRLEEESARAELVDATPAGRVTPLMATIVHGTVANAALGVVVAVVFLAAGFPPFGAYVAGAAAGAVGLSFLAVGLVAGQLMRTSRGANSLAVWVLLLTFVIGGLGNALGRPSGDLQSLTSSWLTWLSPFGWAENTRPFAEDAVWPLALCLIVSVVLGTAAVALQSGRDVGESLIPERAGRVAAGGLLSSSTGLVWRLTWGSLVGWCIGGLVTGLVGTSLASVIDRVGTQIPAVHAIMTALSKEGSLEQGMVVIFFLIVGVLAACAAVQTVCRARQEEARGTAETVRAAPVDRVRWLADYLVVAFVGVVLVVASGVLGAALGAAGSATDSTARTDLVRDAIVSGGGQVAAASVYLVVTAVVFVLAPRWTIGLGWTLVLAGVVLGLFGALFGLPDWVVSIAPIADVPTMSGDTIDIKGLWWLILVSLVGAAAALALMRRRELAADG